MQPRGREAHLGAELHECRGGVEGGLLLLDPKAAVRVHGDGGRFASLGDHRQHGANVRPEPEAQSLSTCGHSLHACLCRGARRRGSHVAHQLRHQVTEGRVIEVHCQRRCMP